MKFFTLSFALAFITFGTTTAQNLLPDSSFESWYTGKYGYFDPSGCDTTFSTNSNYYKLYDTASVLRDTNAHTGSYAIKIVTVYNSTDKKFEGGYCDFYFPINYPPQFLTGWWIGNEGSVKYSEGTASVDIYDSSGTSVIGGCTVNTYGDTAKWSTYKSFTGFITYVQHASIAKYCELKLFVTNQGNDSVPWVTFDDISVNTLSGINVITGSANNNLHVYPNPVINTAHVNYNLTGSGNVRLTLTDILGKTIKTLAEGYQSPGNYSLPLDGSTLSPGLYFCKLYTSAGTAVTKVIVSR